MNPQAAWAFMRYKRPNTGLAIPDPAEPRHLAEDHGLPNMPICARHRPCHYAAVGIQIGGTARAGKALG
jgi:hypothetical protein